MKPLPSSLIAGAVLAGFVACASAQPVHPPPPGPPATICNAGICTIQITVNNCGASGGIKVDPGDLGMPVASGPAVIHWKIVTPGFVFATDGIRFAPPSPQFRPLPSPQPNEIRMRNDKSATGAFYYFVDVLNCIPVDPFIRNF